MEELLAGAGMSGFLGVLDPPAPAPHLEALAGQATYVPADHRQLSLWLSSRLERLSAHVGRQHETLLEISKVTGRINGAAERLNARVQAFVRDMPALRDSARPGKSPGCRAAV
jgi:hypothetical protein